MGGCVATANDDASKKKGGVLGETTNQPEKERGPAGKQDNEYNPENKDINKQPAKAEVPKPKEEPLPSMLDDLPGELPPNSMQIPKNIKRRE
jgi:hypothetical protein